jgi:predicted transposase/invertase (TIGR01784 family)
MTPQGEGVYFVAVGKAVVKAVVEPVETTCIVVCPFDKLRDRPSTGGRWPDQYMVIALALNEPPISDIHDRQIRFDISCKAEEGELINVEMSFNPDAFELKRFEYHVGKLYSTQDIRGQHKTFDDLKATYQVAFLVNRHFFTDDDFIHEFEYYDRKRQVSLGGLTRIFTLELAKLESVVAKPVADMTASERWTVFCRYITDKTKREKINEILEKEEGIAMAGEVLLTISRDEVERARLLSEYKYIVDTQSKVVQAEREKQAEIARNALREGLSIDLIQKITGLDSAIISQLPLNG